MVYYKKGDDICGTPDYRIVSIPITSYAPDINIYPNPSNGLFYIDVTDKRVESIRIMNSSGALVYQSTTPTSEPDLSGLNSGIYHMILQGKTFHSSKRIVKI